MAESKSKEIEPTEAAEGNLEDHPMFKEELSLKSKPKRKPKLKSGSKEDPLDDLDAELDLKQFMPRDEEE